MVPNLHPAKASLTSLVFSEKGWVYLLAAQLWLSEGGASILGTCCTTPYYTGA